MENLSSRILMVRIVPLVVFGAGEMKDGVMEAYGVRKAPDDGSLPPRFLRE